MKELFVIPSLDGTWLTSPVLEKNLDLWVPHLFAFPILLDAVMIALSHEALEPIPEGRFV